MAKVVSVQEFELRPGITPDEFERYIAEQIAPQPMFLGWSAVIGRANRGERDGKYAWIYTMESVEARDAMYPAAGTESDAAKEWGSTHLSEAEGAAWGTWDTLATGWGELPWTDYVIFAEHNPLDRNRALVRRYVEAINTKDLAVFDEVCVPAFAEQWRETLKWLYETFADHHVEIVSLVAEGDTVAVRVKTSGRHT